MHFVFCFWFGFAVFCVLIFPVFVCDVFADDVLTVSLFRLRRFFFGFWFLLVLFSSRGGGLSWTEVNSKGWGSASVVERPARAGAGATGTGV